MVTFQGHESVTQCCCASNRTTVNVEVEEGFWFNFQLCRFFLSLDFFHFYLSPGSAGKCSQSEWKGAKQKQLSAGKRSKKRIKKEEEAREADHREDNNKFMKPEQARTRSDKKFFSVNYLYAGNEGF